MAAVTLSCSRAVPVPADEAFARVLPHPLPELFGRRYLAIPPVKEVRAQRGEWGAVGQTRTVALADGGTMLETLTSLDPSRAFGYTLAHVTGPMKPLVVAVNGLWEFTPAGTGTRISWTWHLVPTKAGRVVMPAFGAMWRGYARQALEEVERVLIPPPAG